jgi:hypothetical protein
LELVNLYHQGELARMVQVAKQTEITFDMASERTAQGSFLFYAVCSELLAVRHLHQRLPCSKTAQHAPIKPSFCLSQITVTACVSALAVAIISYFALRQKPVYLIDFSVYKAPDRWVLRTGWELLHDLLGSRA